MKGQNEARQADRMTFKKRMMIDLKAGLERQTIPAVVEHERSSDQLHFYSIHF